MAHRLLQLYQRKRIININLNVVAAGLLAIGCTKGVVWFVDLFLDRDLHLLFTAIALVCDMVFDVVIYYVLHWVANHWRPHANRTPAHPKPPPFIKDATLIQFERALLAPVYYILAGVLMQMLQKDLGWHPGWAMVVAFTTGLLFTRFLHTAMGLYTGSFKDFPRTPDCPDLPAPLLLDPESPLGPDAPPEPADRRPRTMIMNW